MLFTKMQGCGNDYIYIDTNKEGRPEGDLKEFIKRVSDRHFGVGGDGVIFINTLDGKEADFEMEMYNADGSYSEMCGNGIRCVAKYVYDKGLTDKKDLRIMSGGRVRFIELTTENDKVKKVRVNMGAPILEPAQIPVSVEDKKIAESDKIVSLPITVLNKEYRITCVSMGNPHAVIFLDESEDLDNFDINGIGPKFEFNPFFPRGVTAEFVKIDDKNNVHMRVWERGTGETLACGTGCCATAVACVLNGLTKDHVTVHVLGGEIEIEWDHDKNVIFMTGPAEIVFDGEI